MQFLMVKSLSFLPSYLVVECPLACSMDKKPKSNRHFEKSCEKEPISETKTMYKSVEIRIEGKMARGHDFWSIVAHQILPCPLLGLRSITPTPLRPDTPPHQPHPPPEFFYKPNPESLHQHLS